MSPTNVDGLSILAQTCSVAFHIKRSTDSEYFCYRLAVGENQASKKQNAWTNDQFTFVDGTKKVVLGKPGTIKSFL